MENIYLKINNKIKNSLRIAIIAHRFPDGDTIGSITAFYEVLKINFPEKKIDIVSFDPILSNLKFIPFTNKILKKPKNKHYDLFIFLDLANLSRS
jgi:nanoRNase/pAp phosphatase (c-di-AMP/oligoRNAs hydrolase)